jgi:hypothetical protein
MSLKKSFFIFTVILPFFLCSAMTVQVNLLPDTETIESQEETAFPHFNLVDTSSDAGEEAENDKQITENQFSILLDDDVLAFYGHPNSKNMGILGRFSIEELDQKLTALAAEYEAVSGGRKVKKAFYIIYGTVWPKGEIGILGSETLMRYIDYGLQNDILVFIDHQIGRYEPVDALKRLLPWLRYSNVHLALDPEWRTDKPMVDFGHVTGEEVNMVQKVMEDYMIENNIPGERLLVIHQFNYMMLRNREVVKTDFNRVKLIHCMDGIGHPSMKRDSYAFNALASNMPLKGFKLFYNFGIPGAGYDNPMMTPKEVYDLKPRPYVIMYQ